MSHADSPTNAPDQAGWFTPWRMAGLLAAFLLISFWKILIGGQALVYRDYGLLGYPFLQFHRDSFWAGELPFWNPYVNCGAPFLAQWNTLTLYPGSLIYLLLPMPWSLGLFCVAHIFLAGMGMYFLARRWTGDAFAGAVGGTAFAFSGLMFASLIYPNYLVTLGWMPWVVLTAERGWQQGGRWLVIAAFTGTMQMVTGAPEILLLTWLLLLAMAAGNIWLHRPAASKIITRFVGMVALISGLSAIQLLPFFDLLSHSQRSRDFAGGFWSMPASGFANLFLPLFNYFRTPQGLFVQQAQSFFPSYYLGIAALLLALVGLVTHPRRRTWLLAVAVLFSLCFALGHNGFVYGLLKQLAPVLGFARYPIKFVALAAFALPLLAAFAVTQFPSVKPAGTSRTWAIIAVAGILVAVLGVWAYSHPNAMTDKKALLANIGIRLLVVVVLGALLSALKSGVAVTRNTRLGLVVLIFLDALTTMPRQVPTVESWVFTPGIAQEKLKLTPAPKLGESRVMLSSYAEHTLHRTLLPNLQQDFIGARLALWYNLNILDGIPKINGASTLQPLEQLDVENLIYGNTGDFPALADFLSASHVTVADEFIRWQARTNHLPWVTAGQKPSFATPHETLRQLGNPQFQPRETVYLPIADKATVRATGTKANVSGVTFGNQAAEFVVDATAPAMVVIAQTFYHPWRATVNGQPAPLLRANHGFQALEVPAGKSAVKLEYVDRQFRNGAVITLVTALICGGIWLCGKKVRDS